MTRGCYGLGKGSRVGVWKAIVNRIRPMCRTTNGRQKRNRRVNVNRQGYRYVCDCAISETGTQVWREGYGLMRVFRIVTPNGDAAQGGARVLGHE